MIIDVTRKMLLFRRLRKGARSLFSTPPRSQETDEVVVGYGSEGQSVFWPAPSAQAASHVVCLAASGAGKTVMVGNALLQEFLRGKQEQPPDKQASLLVCDPKGDLVEVILQGLCAMAPDLLSRTWYLNPFSGGFPFNLNKLELGKTPVDIRAMQLASLVSQVSTATGAQRHLGVGARQLDVLQHVLLGALDTDHPNANVLWAMDSLTLPKGMKKLAAITRSPRAKQFLQSARLNDELLASTSARLRSSFAASANLERIVTTEKCIQFSRLLAPGRLTLIDLGQPTGGLTSLQEFWANLLVRLAIEHLMERQSPWTGHHCRVAIDEAQVVAPVLADTAERILTTGRSRGSSLVVLSQGTTLIHKASDTLLQVLMTNAPAKLVGRLAAQDAELLAKSQTPALGVDVSISAIRQGFVAHVTNLPDRDFFRLVPGKRERFKSVEVDMEGWRQATAQQVDKVAALKKHLVIPESEKPRSTLADIRVKRKKPNPSAQPKLSSKWG